jgi:hypothetical protein
MKTPRLKRKKSLSNNTNLNKIMEKSATVTEITKAIVAVMKEVVGIDKSMTVGTGSNAYKGVSDKDVKNAIGKSMEKHGLVIMPIDIEPTLQIDRWTETGGQYGDKQKQSVFTSVKTKYLLMHESGEYIELAGYGHGTDTQDKAAGKATTYALKYTLLYTFMVPTGKIDDADATHSDEIETPKQTNGYPVDDKKWLNEGTKEFDGAVKKLQAGTTTIEKIEAAFKLSKPVKAKLLSHLQPVNN